MEMDCIPAGMELFPAADDDQLEFIKRVIDDCDYYVLIIGGRYGSVDASGISYTQKEYEYAIEKGMQVLAFVHSEPGQIASGKSEQNPDLMKKLEEFRNTVSAGRLVKFWNNADVLPGQVVLALSKAIKTYPAIGWVRASHISATELHEELYSLRRELLQTQKQLKIAQKEQEGPASTNNIKPVSLDSEVQVKIRHSAGRIHNEKTTWKALFKLIAPCLMSVPSDIKLNKYVANSILEANDISGYGASVDREDYDMIRSQFLAYELVTVKRSSTTDGGVALFWKLTKAGHEKMLQITVRQIKE